jgi:hypothetical protein
MLCLHRLQVCSAYHYLLLYADRLCAINQVSGKVVSEVAWGPGSHTPGIVGEWCHTMVRSAGLMIAD